MPKITPFLWFDDNLEEAVEFYTSVFKNAKINYINHLPEGTPGPKGKVLSASFELEGQTFFGLNGGPAYRFTEAISFFVTCDTQDEIDYYWEKLTDGGQEVQCGWLKDRFGLFWQIVPAMLSSLLSNPDAAKAQRAIQAMMKMNKLDIAGLEKAAEG